MPPRTTSSSSSANKRTSSSSSTMSAQQRRINKAQQQEKARQIKEMKQKSIRIRERTKTEMKIIEYANLFICFGFMTLSLIVPMLDPTSTLMRYHSMVSLVACVVGWYVGNPARRVNLILLVLQVLLFIFPLPLVIVFRPEPLSVHLIMAVCYDFLQIWAYLNRDQIRASLDSIDKTNEILAHCESISRTANSNKKGRASY